MGPQDNIQEDEEEIEEDMVLAEVDSGDDSTDSDLDSESTDNESELTDVTMPSTASSTRSGRRAQEEYFFSTKSMYVSSKTIL